MKVPMIGDRLLYFGKLYKVEDQPQHAVVCYVHNDRCVNIALFDRNGNAVANPPREVFLLQSGDVIPDKTVYCKWPDVPRSVAALEARIAEEEAKAAIAANAAKEKTVTDEKPAVTNSAPTSWKWPEQPKAAASPEAKTEHS
jgi:hypothetical protein